MTIGAQSDLTTVNSRYNDTVGSQQSCRCIEYVGILNDIETRKVSFICFYSSNHSTLLCGVLKVIKYEIK